jgi:hypothetical protein
MENFDNIFRRRESEIINQDPPTYTVEAEDTGMIFGYSYSCPWYIEA